MKRTVLTFSILLLTAIAYGQGRSIGSLNSPAQAFCFNSVSGWIPVSGTASGQALGYNSNPTPLFASNAGTWYPLACDSGGHLIPGGSFAADVTAAPYNAKCDGHTNDSAALQAALDGNTAVYIPFASAQSGPTQCNFATTLVLCSTSNKAQYNAIYGQGQILDYTGLGTALDATACPNGLLTDIQIQGTGARAFALSTSSAFLVEDVQDSHTSGSTTIYGNGGLVLIGDGTAGVSINTQAGSWFPWQVNGQINLQAGGAFVASGASMEFTAPVILMAGIVQDGTATSTNTDQRGSLTLVAGTATYTFTAGPTSGAWLTAPICQVQDTNFAHQGTTTLTVTTASVTIGNSVGTTDTYSYVCSIGN